MDELEAGTGVGQDSVLEVRLELLDSEPKIWRDSSLGDPSHPDLTEHSAWVAYMDRLGCAL